MQILPFEAENGRSITNFESFGLTVTQLARSVASAACLRLAPGGVIGRHPAVGRQIFAVVTGTGTVCGSDRRVVPIVAGQAAIWAAGEEHETRSTDGLTAIVLEGSSVELLLGDDLDLH